MEDIFSDEEEGVDGVADRRRGPTGAYDDMGDFIEEDIFDDEEGKALQEDIEVRRPARGGVDLSSLQTSGLDEADLEDMRAAFGDGTEYDWALAFQEDQDIEQQDPDKPLELKDVFEPSQLIEKMLTDDDNVIRAADVPERFQLARNQYKEVQLSDDEIAERAAEEAKWVSNLLLPKKRLAPDLTEPFEQAVAKVLQFMNVEDFEVPFIFQHRKDYLIHAVRVPQSPDPNDPGAPDFRLEAEKLLTQNDLWDVFELDLKFRALVEKREGLIRAVDSLKTMADFNDPVFDEMIPAAETMEELQDVQDYLHFQYAAQLKDVSIVDTENTGTQKRARGTRSIWDRLRSGPPYHVVRAFGITADAVAQNVLKTSRRTYTEDTNDRPEDLADTLIVAPEYSTGQQVLGAAKAMFTEELTLSPRMRKVMRQYYYSAGVFDVYRTEKGLRQIDEEHPYYEFKYLRGQEIRVMAQRPELFLRMLKAEEDGLVEVRLRLVNERKLRDDLYKSIESDNYSEVADAWNTLRKEVLDVAVRKLAKIISKGVKENLKDRCEKEIGTICREEYSKRLDQAPYKPKGMMLGTLPRVLALSNGAGNRADAICWAYLEESGRVLENGKFTDLRLGNQEKYIEQGKDVKAFVELVERRKPDVVAVGGWSVETRRLYKDLQDIIENADLKGTPYEDDDDREISDPLEVVIANDEVARLYHTSDRANVDYPGLAPLTKYAIALAKYMQNPMKEYAALGRDINSISFDPNQHLLPEDKLLKQLETAMVDMVNLVGVEVNEAVNDSYTANLLPYVCGLGPRKAAQLLKVINLNGGEITTREELVGDIDRNKRQAVGPKVWTNCASFLYIAFDDSEPEADYLDNTRIHPEDYDIARKMAADALELDEEDIKAETDENGANAVVRKLIKDEMQDRVNDLLLEQYAEQLETQFSQKKRATLETIRAELQNPFEELRRNFSLLSTNEIFTMLTGETQDSLTEGMIIPVSVKRTFTDHIECKLDCGVEGGVGDSEFPEDMARKGLEPRQVWSQHQTIQAKLTYLDRKKFTAQLSLRQEQLEKRYRKDFDHGPDEWDDMQESKDRKEALKQQDGKAGRAQRVIKHPLFRPFNSAQAEEFLGSQGRGDCVIRPSSKGLDHLAVTWKISDNIYQHIDVLELDKENEFSVGRTLKIGGRYSYSDLDELIVLHVQAMAKKVDEMMTDERYQTGSKKQTGWSSQV